MGGARSGVKRSGIVVMLVTMCALTASQASAHPLPKSLARQITDTVMKRVCHDDLRPCRGWQVARCARRSSHRVDCRASHSFVESRRVKTCRMWVTNELRGSVVYSRILRATVRCGLG